MLLYPSLTSLIFNKYVLLSLHSISSKMNTLFLNLLCINQYIMCSPPYMICLLREKETINMYTEEDTMNLESGFLIIVQTFTIITSWLVTKISKVLLIYILSKRIKSYIGKDILRKSSFSLQINRVNTYIWY